ncbi:MAG: DUF1294 domain-containing protein [Planctomycetota bacterium]
MDLARWILLLVALAQLVSFSMFGLDKHFARRGRRRIPESWLLASAFLFGLGGGWAAMSVFRHKTRKTSFRWKMVAVSVVNPLWLLVWMGLHGDLR